MQCAQKEILIFLYENLLSIPVSFVESSGCNGIEFFLVVTVELTFEFGLFFYMLGLSVFVFLWSIVWKLGLRAIFK